MNRIIHFEIHAKDLDVAQKFYSDVFGWDVQDMGAEMGNYRIVRTGKDTPGIDGGITLRAGGLPVEGQPTNAYVCIIGVDAIDDYLEKVKSAGGTIVIEKTDMPKVGLLAYCKDLDGNTFGMLQPSPDMPQ